MPHARRANARVPQRSVDPLGDCPRSPHDGAERARVRRRVGVDDQSEFEHLVIDADDLLRPALTLRLQRTLMTVTGVPVHRLAAQAITARQVIGGGDHVQAGSRVVQCLPRKSLNCTSPSRRNPPGGCKQQSDCATWIEPPRTGPVAPRRAVVQRPGATTRNRWRRCAAPPAPGPIAPHRCTTRYAVAAE